MQDESAAASAMAFLAAGILFIAAIAVVLNYTNGQIPPEKPNRAIAGHHEEAEAILGLVVSSEGRNWNDTTHRWDANFRPSLAQSIGVIDSDKLASFNPTTCTSHTCVTIADARTKFGLGNLTLNLKVTDDSGMVRLNFGDEPPTVSSGVAVQPASAYATLGTTRVLVVVSVFPN